jgi:ribonuclease P protein component
LIGEQHLTKTEDFALVQAHGQRRWDRLLSIKSRPNGLISTRWGVVTSKRVGKAVQRNRVRRRLREIIRVLPLRAGYDLVVTARPDSVDAKFTELHEVLRRLLAEARLLE